jgi:hypothetical protein
VRGVGTGRKGISPNVLLNAKIESPLEAGFSMVAR